MTHLLVARSSLALLCAVQGIATMAIDLNRTHATNPLWPAHARFHVVWQTANAALLSVLEIALILIRGPFQEQRFYLAAILASLPMAGFLAALIGRKAYGGALSDPNGIQPVRVKLFGSLLRIDLNLAAVTVGILALAAIVVLFAH